MNIKSESEINQEFYEKYNASRYEKNIEAQKIQFFSFIQKSKLGQEFASMIDAAEEIKQKDCFQNRRMSEMVAPETHFPKTRKRRNKKEIYSKFYDALKINKITNADIFSFIAKFELSRSFLIKRENGHFVAFEARRKGTENYAFEKKMLLKDIAVILRKIYKFGYFGTLTIDPKNFENDLEKIWKFVDKEVSKFFKKIHKRIRIAYQRAFEAHKSGMIHIHFLMFTNHDFHITKKNFGFKKGHKYIKNGEFKEFIEHYWKWGFQDLQLIESDEQCEYVAKYVSKCFTVKTDKDGKAKKFDHDDRKKALTFAIPYVCGIRQFATSERKTILKAAAEKMTTQEIREFYEAHPKNELGKELMNLVNPRIEALQAAAESEREARSLLERACTKSHFCSYRSIAICKKLDLNAELNADFKSLDLLSQKNLFNLYIENPKIGCQGCIFSELFELANLDSCQMTSELSLNKTEDEKRMIRYIFEEAGFPKIGFHPYHLNMKLICAMFPDSAYSKQWRKRFEVFELKRWKQYKEEHKKSIFYTNGWIKIQNENGTRILGRDEIQKRSK